MEFCESPNQQQSFCSVQIAELFTFDRGSLKKVVFGNSKKFFRHEFQLIEMVVLDLTQRRFE